MIQKFKPKDPRDNKKVSKLYVQWTIVKIGLLLFTIILSLTEMISFLEDWIIWVMICFFDYEMRRTELGYSWFNNKNIVTSFLVALGAYYFYIVIELLDMWRYFDVSN